MATKNGTRPHLVPDDVSGFGDGLGTSAYVDSSGVVHVDDAPPITASVPKQPATSSQPATSIVTRNEFQTAGMFDFLEGQIFGLPKVVVYGAAAFAVYWFFIRGKKGRR